MASLVRRRSRVFITLLSVVVGSTILSGLSLLYYDIPHQLAKAFRSYGANLVMLPAKGQTRMNISLEKEVLSHIDNSLTIGVTPFRYESLRVNQQPLVIAGTNFDSLKKTSPYWHIKGEWPHKKGEVVIGQEVAKKMRLSLGSSLTISLREDASHSTSQTFVVSAIVQTGGKEESFLFMNLIDLESLTHTQALIDILECSIALSGKKLQNLAYQLNHALSSQAIAYPIKRVSESEWKVLSKLQSLVYLVTLISSLLTITCVATTTVATIMERRIEIGLKKALGASRYSIIQDFLVENLILASIGFLIGMLLGFLFAQWVSWHIFGYSLKLHLSLIPIFLVLLAISLLITSLACLLPMRKAIEIDPAIVLRGE